MRFSSRVLLLLALLPAHVAPAAAGALTADDVRRLVKIFSSLAAETVFFLDEIDRRHLAVPYARVHLDKLRQELDQTRQEIAQASPPQARNLKIHASRLGDALWVQLDTLDGKLEDRAARQRAHDEAVRVRDALESLKA